MFIAVGAWISPGALAALALGVTLGLRAPWWAVLLVVAACAVLAAAAVRLLMRWSDAHAARVWSQRPVQLHAEAVRELPRERPAIPQVVNINLYGADVTRAAAVIRQALPEGGDGDGGGSR